MPGREAPEDCEAMTPLKGTKTEQEVLEEALAADPQFAAEWERLTLGRGRMDATRPIAYRSETGI